MARKYVRFSPRIAIAICNAIAEGKSLRSICTDPTMPTKRNFLRWVARMPTLQRRYEKAMDMRADHYAEEIIEISDELPEPVKSADGKVVTVIAKGWTNRQRLRIDARKWTAAKLKPKKYGDRMALTGVDGQPLIPPSIAITFPDGGPGSATSNPDGVETS